MMPGWIGLALFVVIYDGWAIATKRSTMSSAYKSGLRSRRWITMASAFAVLAHLHEDDIKKIARRS